MTYVFQPIGILHSCYKDRFGIPRQPGLVTAAEAWLELYPEYAREEAFAGLTGFSHVWLIFVFHESIEAGWRPTVRPPRLGGRRKVGVFASRAPYRPNPIGISAVELVGLDLTAERCALRLRGADLLDGTPVLDLKPYVPYADAIPHATGGFARHPPGREWAVEFTAEAKRQLSAADPSGALRLEQLITQILRQDPRPGYMDRYPQRNTFGMRLYDLEVQWQLTGEGVQVTAIDKTAD